MYLCDIKVNFNKNYYDFFDWNKSDKMIMLKKTPLYYVNNLENLINNNVKFSKDFLDKIKNETEVIKYEPKYKYACVLTNRSKFIAVILDKNGSIKEISDINITDDIELNQDLINQRIKVINYELLNIRKKIKFLTREEIKIKEFLNNKINKNCDYEQLKYIYFENFNKKEENIDKIVRELKKILNKDWDNNYLRIYNLFKVTS